MVHTLGLAAFCFLRFGTIPLLAITETISAGGDTDTTAAALTDLDDLAKCLVKSRGGTPSKPRPFNFLLAFARNLLIIPVLLFHAVMRFIP